MFNDIALSIFLSTLFIGLIIFFNITKDRLNWSKIVKVTIALLIFLPLIGFGVQFGLEKYKSRPKKITEYLDIRLGDSSRNAMFLKGPFTNYKIKAKNVKANLFELMDPDKYLSDSNKKYEICESIKFLSDAESASAEEREKLVKKFTEITIEKPNECIVFEYEFENSSSEKTKHIVGFDKNSIVNVVMCENLNYNKSACPLIFSIGIGSTYNEVIDIVGTPKNGYTQLGVFARELYYEKYNLRFFFQEGKVFRLGVATQIKENGVKEK